MSKFTTAVACGLFALAAASAGPASAGMGKVFPTYHPKPCSGDDCRADDARSNRDCTGLLCSFSSAKAMQPPVTAAQAEAAQARAAAAAAAAPPPDAVPVAAPAKRKAKRVAKSQTPAADRTAPVARTPAPPPTAEAAR